MPSWQDSDFIAPPTGRARGQNSGKTLPLPCVLPVLSWADCIRLVCLPLPSWTLPLHCLVSQCLCGLRHRFVLADGPDPWGEAAAQEEVAALSPGTRAARRFVVVFDWDCTITVRPALSLVCAFLLCVLLCVFLWRERQSRGEREGGEQRRRRDRRDRQYRGERGGERERGTGQEKERTRSRESRERLASGHVSAVMR